MSEFKLSQSELTPQNLVLEGGLLRPLIDAVREKQGFRYKYVIRKPGHSDWEKESTYFLKPEANANSGEVDKYVTVWDVQGDMYGMSPEVETLPEGTRYSLEEKELSGESKTSVLTLTLPHQLEK